MIDVPGIAPLILAASLLVACKSEIDGKPAAEVAEVDAKAAAPSSPKSIEGATIVRVDPDQSRVGFVGSKVTLDHRGSFERVGGKLALAGDEPASVEITVHVDSLKISPEKLSRHLLSADFFHVEEHSTAHFISRSITPDTTGGHTHRIEGDLTLRGTTRTVAFAANVENTAEGMRGSAKFTIDRKDFGIVYPGAPDDLIKDQVLLDLDLLFPTAT